MSEPEKFKARSALEDHLHRDHKVQVPRRLLRLWTIEELVKAHEEGHQPPMTLGLSDKPRDELPVASQGCICLSASDADSYVRLTNPLCPVHGDVRDTGFVIDSKDDYITAIEDAIEELDMTIEKVPPMIPEYGLCNLCGKPGKVWFNVMLQPHYEHPKCIMGEQAEADR